MNIHINDIPYKRTCYKGSYLYDPFFINYDISLMDKEEKISNFMYIIFYSVLLKLLKEVEKGIEVRVDNLEDVIFSKMKQFIPYDIVSSPVSLLRFEKLSRVLSSKIIEILTDLSGGVIVQLDQKVNSSIRSIGESSYVNFTIDFAYFNKEEKLKLILFEPFKRKTSYNSKTALAFSFWEELAVVDSISVFSFGSNLSDLSNLSYMIAFEETVIKIDDRKREILNGISKSIKGTFLIKNISYDHCYQCIMKDKCGDKIHV